MNESRLWEGGQAIKVTDKELEGETKVKSADNPAQTLSSDSNWDSPTHKSAKTRVSNAARGLSFSFIPLSISADSLQQQPNQLLRERTWWGDQYEKQCQEFSHRMRKHSYVFRPHGSDLSQKHKNPKTFDDSYDLNISDNIIKKKILQ